MNQETEKLRKLVRDFNENWDDADKPDVLVSLLNEVADESSIESGILFQVKATISRMISFLYWAYKTVEYYNDGDSVAGWDAKAYIMDNINLIIDGAEKSWKQSENEVKKSK